MSDNLEGISESGIVAKAANDIIDLFSRFTEHFKPYQPELRVVTFDYTEQTWEAKYFLNVKSGWRRKTKRRVEVPAYLGASVAEVYEGDAFMPLKVKFDRKGQKWIINADQFPNSDNFFVTLRGEVARSFLDNWVKIRVSADSSNERGVDKFWVHAALSDVSVLKRIHDEFNVDKVRADVRVGVEQIMATTIPKHLKARLQAQKELMDALESKSRSIAQLRAKYRRTVQTSRLHPMEILAFIAELVSGDYFRGFLEIDQPFQMGQISPDGFVESLPERVRVEVFTRLNLDTPVSEGSLIFRKAEYIKSISSRFEEFLKEKKTEKERTRKK